MKEISESITCSFLYDGANLIWRPIEVKTWRDKAWNTLYAGRVAGTIKKKDSGAKYLQVWVGGGRFYAHRIIWSMVNGMIDEGMEVDHIDGDGINNRIDNLRLVKSCENRLNQPIPSSNTSGSIGVYWHKKRMKWYSSIKVNGKSKHLGYFSTFSEALNCRKNAEKKMGFHENHGRKKNE